MSHSLYARLQRRFRPDGVSRRDVLKAALAASGTALLSNCIGTSSSEFSSRGGRRVVIIGGGFAGLACAYELHAVGYDVVILEARSRIGGRVLTFTDMSPNKHVEGGGELIGTNHPTWIAYAKKLGLTLKQTEDDESLAAPIVLAGRTLEPEEAKKLYNEMDTAFATLNEAATGVDADEPWKTSGAASMDARSMGDWFNALSVSHDTKRAIRAELEANEGVSLERLGYLAFLSMVKGGGVEKYWTDSEILRCLDGNQTLAKRLAAKLGSRIHMGTNVVSIVVGDNKVMVSTEAGERFIAEDVVLTAPPSTWKGLRISPALPPELAPQMGPAVKYLAAVKRRFWKDSKLAPDSLTDGDIAMTWDGTALQSGEQGAVLVGFSGGPAAEHLRTRLSADREQYCRTYLDRIFPAFADNLETTRFMNWPNDPWTQAGYTILAPRQLTTIGRTLREGIGRLHFAGEYASFAFPGYMEGALSTGVATARRLAKRDNVV